MGFNISVREFQREVIMASIEMWTSWDKLEQTGIQLIVTGEKGLSSLDLDIMGGHLGVNQVNQVNWVNWVNQEAGEKGLKRLELDILGGELAVRPGSLRNSSQRKRAELRNNGE